MIINSNTLQGYKLEGLDGELGGAKEFLFDDEHWAIRYLVVETGHWMMDRQVLISPLDVVSIDDEVKRINVNLTKKQVEDSPLLGSDKPVSRQFETQFHEFYGWPIYWGGPYMWGLFPYANRIHETSREARLETSRWDPHLQSTHDVSGQHIQAEDGEIGHVKDFLVDTETWAIRYFVVDTRNWWPGKKVLISPKWIDRVSWRDSKLFVNLKRDAIQGAPAYSDYAPLTRDLETAMHEYYDRQAYWEEESVPKVPVS